MKDRSRPDLLVIGGGPAGMMAAGRAAERGASVVLLEKNPTLGRKLLISGGGRCNFTNAEPEVRALAEHYGPAKHALLSPFTKSGGADGGGNVSSGCQLGGGGPDGAWAIGVFAALAMMGRRRRSPLG